jgi:hypothetical protein
LSGGNPRQVLRHAKSICRLAAQSGKVKVTPEFIHDAYAEVFEKSFMRILADFTKSSDKFEKGLRLLYTFHVELERRNLNPAEGWRYVLETLKTCLEQKNVSPAFYGPLRQVSFIDTDPKSKAAIYRPDAAIVEVFRRLERKGFSAPDFVAFYSASPILPGEEERDSFADIGSAIAGGEDFEHFERARQKYLDLQRTKMTPPTTITTAWDCIESLLVAILAKHAEYSPLKLAVAKEPAFYVDRYQMRRYRTGAGQVLADSANMLVSDFKLYLKAKKVWMISYNGMKWILASRNNIVRGGMKATMQLAERERDLCLAHLEPVFKELVRLYG